MANPYIIDLSDHCHSLFDHLTHPISSCANTALEQKGWEDVPAPSFYLGNEPFTDLQYQADNRGQMRVR